MITIICDDNKKELENIKNIIKDIDYIEHYYLCRTGQEMIDIAKNNPVDLLITDIDLPNKNGIEAVGEVKKRYKHDVKIIFMTGFPEYSINSHNYRPIDFLVKPIDKHRLLESIAIAHDMIESDKIVKQAKVYDSIFTYKFRKSINMLNYKSILCFEKNGRNVNIYLDDDKKISYYEDFDNLKSRLPMYFFATSSKYIVNLEKVYKISPLTRTNLEISFSNSNIKAILNKNLESEFLYRYHKANY